MNTNDKSMTMLYMLTIKNIKTTVPLFLFPEGPIHQNQSVYFYFHALQVVETIFKMKLNIHFVLVTKYADTLTFDFAHTVNPKWSIMPL